jgi:hypothetical protein
MDILGGRLTTKNNKSLALLNIIQKQAGSAASGLLLLSDFKGMFTVCLTHFNVIK